ncbi:hypothetical protein WKI68_35540 [Streptomyces sp. MS1.HAVA.3]|uniref:HNH endonuclease n=1 Tax=Streptomyces caledonius TaxID=3134107 RepID=A0ABU8UB31_9ACTN
MSPRHRPAGGRTPRRRQDKGSRTADKWQPPRRAYRCEYARRYTGIKAEYRLSVTPPEKLALQEMPAACPQ